MMLDCARRCLEVRERGSRQIVIWVRLDAVEVRGVVLGDVRHVRHLHLHDCVMLLLLHHVGLLTAHGVLVVRYVGLVDRCAPRGMPK